MRIAERDVIKTPRYTERFERLFFRSRGKVHGSDIDRGFEWLVRHDTCGDGSRERRDRKGIPRAAFGQITRDATHAVPAHFRFATVGIVDAHLGSQARRVTHHEDAVSAVHWAVGRAQRARERIVSRETRRPLVDEHEHVAGAVHLEERRLARGRSHRGKASGACGEIVETACL